MTEDKSEGVSGLIALAERCEEATGPDRELDVAIVYGLHPEIGSYEGQCQGDTPIFWHEPYRKQPCPRFTASLDAAMTLVPEGWCWQVRFDPRHSGAVVLAQDGFDQHHTVAETPALALCAAALRASSA